MFWGRLPTGRQILTAMSDGVVGRRTGIEIGLGVAVVGGIISIMITVLLWVRSDAVWKTRVEDRLSQIEKTAETAADDRWTRTDMKIWATQFEALNPDAHVPSVQ